MKDKVEVIELQIDMEEQRLSGAQISIDRLCESIMLLCHELTGLMELMKNQQIEDQWFDGLAMGLDILSLFEPAIRGYIEAIKAAMPEVGLFAAMFPKLSVAFESVCTWAGEAAKAVGASFIAIGGSVTEGIKSLGSLIAQLAVSTAEWVKNTAAKAASTAAEWAQIAATTAWNALCAVATTVTTAFGAAMAFLTSPIGLVVVAITALIAIIVLLVKNWDTVKAAAVSVWETIQSAFGVAAAWFEQNVVQPVAGFFTNMWAGVLQGASAVWAGIQAVFSTVAGFFGKVFSEAWAGVVKVFSTAGNIFTNIKDGIVTVFKSVVNGLITGINAMKYHASWSREHLLCEGCYPRRARDIQSINPIKKREDFSPIVWYTGISKKGQTEISCKPTPLDL